MFLLKQIRFIKHLFNKKVIVNKQTVFKFSSNDLLDANEVENTLEDSKFKNLYPQSWAQLGLIGHNVLLVVPRQRFGESALSNEMIQHLTDETIALINTLKNWKVVDTIVMFTPSLNKKQIFGSGNLDIVKKKFNSNPSITAIVFGNDMLNSTQLTEMQNQFGVNVYDRFTIILQIFKEHARTKEARLQIALAELPYLKNNMHNNNIQSKSSHLFGSNTDFEKRKLILHEREKKLNNLLKKLQTSRELHKQNRTRKEFPIVAVVGYTNGGKTSLIKALTNDSALVPKDQLFATLDVTVHCGQLPSTMQVLYLDTIGFISNIPDSLIKSFNATLGEICDADVVVHVSDLSHPNYAFQNQTVHKTLEIINVPQKLKDTMIEVANKIDIINDQQLLDSCDKLPISATKLMGINNLAHLIEQKIIINTERLNMTIRVSNGGDDYEWLCKHSVVRSCQEDPNDCNYLLLDILITKTALSKFKHHIRKILNS